jgi:CIC family chloride channel protein
VNAAGVQAWWKRVDAHQVGRLLGVYGLVGVIVGLAAVGFEAMLDTFSNWVGVAPGRHFGVDPGETPDTMLLRTPSGSEWLVLPIATLGGLLSGAICAWLAEEAMGSGVGQVVASFHKARGAIRHRVAWVKALTASITISSGGSAGYEGPISQIGAGLAATLSDWMKLATDQRRILVVAGMAAGIGAMFHAPMAAAILAAEIMYSQMDLEHEVLVPSIIASTIAYGVFGALAGWEPMLVTPEVRFESGLELLGYTVLAAVVAVTAVAFQKTVSLVHDWIGENPRIRLWARPAVGGLLVGGIGLVVPQVLGGTYDLLQLSLDTRLSIPLLAAAVVLKMVASALTCGSGGSGGLFAPSLVVGGMTGALTGEILAALIPGYDIPSAAFAIVGMAGFLAAVFRVPLSAVILVSEVVGNYQLLVPALWVCVLAWLFTRRFTLYKEQVPTRFDDPHQLAEMMAGVLERVSVREAMDLHRPTPERVTPETPLVQLVDLFAKSTQAVFPIVDPVSQKLLGVVDGHLLRRSLNEQGLGVLLIARDFQSPAVTLTPVDTLREAITRMSSSGYDELVVVDPTEGSLVGLLSRREVVAAYHRKVLARGGIRERSAERPVVTDAQLDLGLAIQRGGVVRGVTGTTPLEVLRNLTAQASFPEGTDREALYRVVEERERLGSTGIGEGIALPHPTTNDLPGLTQPVVVIAPLARPVDWQALDGAPVRLVVLLLAPGGATHLKLLSLLARALSAPGSREVCESDADTTWIAARLAEAAAPPRG